MAKREATAARRRAFLEDLRRASSRGELKPGDMLPSSRDLAEKYQLSVGTILHELRALIDEGSLRAVPRVGIFVARPISPGGGLYLLLTLDSSSPFAGAPHISRIRMGFEQRVGEFGASTITLPAEAAIERRQAGALADLVGVLDLSAAPSAVSQWPADDRVERVTFNPGVSASSLRKKDAIDTIHFDDVDGGRQAATHLIDHGHRKIAFLGLHANGPGPDLYAYSRLREAGWREALAGVGENPSDLTFLPDREPRGYDDDVRVAVEVALRLLPRPDITGVVCADDHAALGLFTALRDSDVLPERWPAVVGFEDLPEARSYVLTSLRVPWEDVGRTAADVLCDRSAGRLTGPPQLFDVRMTLVSRVSTQDAWSHRIGDVLNHLS
jgi:DNA-binding LacI/PurR family transcriptional regulator